MRRPPAALEAGGLLGLLAAAALLCSRSLALGASYDEGVYLASAEALARGETLGEDVFASQPPGFYLLLRLALLFPGDSLDEVRAVFLGLAVAGVAGAWGVGRALAGPTGGFLAGAVLLTAPAYAAESVRVAADTASIALALVGLALLAWALRRELVVLAVVAGAILAAAISVKLFAATALVPAVGLLVGFRAGRRLALGWLAGGLGVALALVVLHAGSLGAIWDDAVRFHEEARGDFAGVDSNADRLAEVFLRSGLVYFWLVAAGLLVWVLRRARPRLLLPLWLWGLASAAFLLWHRPLIDHHFVLIAASFAVPAGASLHSGGAAAAALAGGGGRARARPSGGLRAAVAPDRAAAGRRPPARTRRRGGGCGDGAWRGDRLGSPARRLPRRPAAAGRARRYLGRPLPLGLARPACVLGAADAAGVRLVVAGRAFRIQPGVLPALRARFPEQREVAGITLLERSPAAARAAQRAAPESCS